MVFKFNENVINEGVENQSFTRHYDYVNDEGHYVWECDDFNIIYDKEDNRVTVKGATDDGTYGRSRFGSDDVTPFKFIKFIDNCSDSNDYATILDFIDFDNKRSY